MIRKRKPSGYWTREKVVQRLRDFVEEHGVNYLRPSNLRDNESDLFGAVKRTFGSFEAAIEEAGYNYEKIIGQKPHGHWTKERIVERLREIAEKHGESYLRPSNLRENEGDLYNAIWKTFGSFKEPIEEAGFDYKKIRGILFSEPKIWKAWEKCCREIAEEFFGSDMVQYKKKIKRTRLYPDLQIPNKELIIDAKLSAWDRTSIDKDIDNYVDYCKKLEFWCLEGSRETSSDMVEIVTAKDLLKQLKDSGVEENKLREFRRRIGLIKGGYRPLRRRTKRNSEVSVIVLANILNPKTPQLFFHLFESSFILFF